MISLFVILVRHTAHLDLRHTGLSKGKALFLLHVMIGMLSSHLRGGRVVRWCWVNFQCRGVLLIWIIVGFNRLGGLSLPRKSVVRLTDRPDMTLDVYRGRKTIQHYSRARAYCACSRCGWGLLGHFSLSVLSLLFLPLSGRRPDID